MSGIDVSTRPKRPSRFYDDEIEPKALCRNCEYFDGGGLTDDGKPISMQGDCHNLRSPRFTTSADQFCASFFPCSIRWPNADHG